MAKAKAKAPTTEQLPFGKRMRVSSRVVMVEAGRGMDTIAVKIGSATLWIQPHNGGVSLTADCTGSHRYRLNFLGSGLNAGELSLYRVD